ncbi:MAG: NAD-dependent epimerase/dehydratase family protein [Bacteroidia bacterium]|nr:NAD-dependent epimerase/dehydratase family protein [Bacteroidia bacterium]
MKVFLTGLTGYIGYQLGLKLAQQGIKVHGLVRDINSKRVPVHQNIRIFEGDICDYESVKKGVSGCQFTFHMAALTNLKCKDVKKYYCSNVTGTKNVMEASLIEGVEKLVYTSTLSVYGRSINGVHITEDQPRVGSFNNDYELTKCISEELVQDYVKKGLHCVVLNITRVFGPGLKTQFNGVNKVIEKLINGKILIVPNRLNKRANYVFIDDVVHAHINAAKYGRMGERYIIGGINADYQELFDNIKKVSEKQTRIVSIDYNLMKFGIISIELASKLIRNEPQINLKILESLFTDKPASSRKAINELKYNITPLKRGLSKTIEHLKSY